MRIQFFSGLFGPGLAYLDGYDREVRMCSASTSYVGPEYNQYTLENLFRTAEIVPEPKKAKLLRGHVPEWISGNWFRTGPGKYEFGNDKYENWADPQAFWQKMTFDKGEISYQSKFQFSNHHKLNEEAGFISYPELGTWGNPEECNPENDPDNSNLGNWLSNDPEFVSDNAYVSFFSVGGALYASGETYFLQQIDPVSLTAVRRIALDEILPKTLFANNPTRCKSVVSHLAHSHYDHVTDEFFSALTCMGESLYGTKIYYAVYKIPNAGKGLSQNPKTFEEMWSTGVIVAEIEGNRNAPMHLDFAQEYFHDFALTENFVILGLSSLHIDFLKMPQLMLNRQPMAFGAVWDEENDAYFYLAPRNPKKPFLTREKPKRFTADPFFGTHVINAYEVPEENKVIFDTTWADNNRQFGTTWIANYTANIEKLAEIFHFVAPLQVPSRFEFDLSASGDSHVTPTPLFKKGHMPAGGADFPTINYESDRGKKYDSAFFGGFRETFAADSLYKLNLASGESLCRFKEGYLPGEPKFIQNPKAKNSDDGVLLVVWHSLDRNSKPILSIIDGQDLSLVGEVELPVSFIPMSVHGVFYNL